MYNNIHIIIVTTTVDPQTEGATKVNQLLSNPSKYLNYRSSCFLCSFFFTLLTNYSFAAFAIFVFAVNVCCWQFLISIATVVITLYIRHEHVKNKFYQSLF